MLLGAITSAQGIVAGWVAIANAESSTAIMNLKISMKYQFQIVGAQQYEYIMGEGDFASPEVAVEEYRALRQAFQPQVGLTDKEFNRAVDEYMGTGTLKSGTELYAQMNDKQKFFFQCLKKHGKRNGYQEDKERDMGEGFSGDGQS